jgi:hypothetical protein
LGHLNEGEHRKQNSKKTLDHSSIAISNSIADFGVSCAISLKWMLKGPADGAPDPRFGDQGLPWLRPS